MQPQLTEELLALLCRPVVLEEPQRVVHPPSWLEHIPFAFWIVDVVRPDTFVELGTQSGNSYSAFAQAISRLDLPTRAFAVDSWKGDGHAGFYAESVFEEWRAYHDAHFSSFSRLVRSTFAEAAEQFPDGSIDLLHLDGCHTYDAVAADFELWRPKMSARGVLLFHDTNVRERDFGVWRFWEELSRRHPSFEFLHGHGLGVIAIGSEIPPSLRSLLAVTTADEIVVIRRFFAQRGSAIAARHAAAEAERAARTQAEEVSRLRLEVERLTVELTASTARHQSALSQKDQELSQLRHGAEQLSRRLADESALRAHAERDRDQLATSMYRRVRTRLVRGFKRLEAGTRRS
jgi:O-antigen biosynthesis protein